LQEGALGEQSYQYDQSKRLTAKRYEKIKLVMEVFSGTIIPVTVCFSLMFSGFSEALARLLLSTTESYWVSLAVYLLFFIIILQVIETPFQFYSGFVVDHKFRLSTQNLKGWLADEMKGIGIELAFGIGAGMVLYYLIRATDFWWLVAAALFAVISMIMSIILPYVIMPIFYKMTPLSDPVMKNDLLDMSRKVGARNIEHVLVADESRRSVRANAMFSGIGRSKAIVLFDTLINNFPRREVTTVVAHELGHYVDKDIWKETLISGLMIIPSFFLADRLLRFGVNSGVIQGISDPSGIPIVFAVLIAVSFLLQPIYNAYSRLLESEADGFALRAANDPDAQASAERRLADMSLSVDTPSRFIELFFYTHPSSSRRVKLAEEWKKSRTEKE
jgi:STE24 endopeptidase